MEHAIIAYLEGNGFKLTRFDLDIWIRGRRGGYNYIGTHNDDALVVDVDLTSIFEKLKKTYTINNFGLPKFHLGCDYAQVKKVDTTQWVIRSTTYILECLRKVCALLKLLLCRRRNCLAALVKILS